MAKARRFSAFDRRGLKRSDARFLLFQEPQPGAHDVAR